MSRRLIALSTLLLGLAPVSAENWPQWRGPKNDGHSSEKGLPSEWSETKNVVWKVKMPGPGSSTPCVWGDKLFFTSMVDTDVYLMCFGTDGQEKWRKQMGSGSVRTMRDEGGNLASASCSMDGKLVFALVGSGKLAAFDLDGNEKWNVDLQTVYGKYSIQFGTHWTPVLHEGKLYVTVMHREAQMILCFDATTGKEIWKANRTSDAPKGVESPDVYASPFLWTKGSEALLIVHGNDYCTAHSLKDGSEVWRVTELNPKGKETYNRAWRAVSSPLVTPDLIVVPSCKNGVTVAVDPAKAKGDLKPGSEGELWRIPRGTPDVPSPLIVDDVLYFWKETNSLIAYDVKTGKRTGELNISNERHRANPVYADGKIIVVGRDGTMATVKPGREPELISKMKLPDSFTASPVVSGGRIYLRGWNNLWAIGTK